MASLKTGVDNMDVCEFNLVANKIGVCVCFILLCGWMSGMFWGMLVGLGMAESTYQESLSSLSPTLIYVFSNPLFYIVMSLFFTVLMVWGGFRLAKILGDAQTVCGYEK